ncbi:uncharacterized protein CANTADRAFT_56501 [Suhomyces tanzawaensis NRRL Y-17324]|uniref:Uncharacterized protein n=1 Tax=Suhomyces tanzawaensis NRRL Y-17324 TaxID=984487 RepID=A0A1E4SCK3_9ASCO|nr:uncharacterized protein CANTADRAFT_56501 [Suhomyces tanzawaensis NRRL Y-17324]ODV77244.1 hypothetical protein CANTADRAFT_56501 [Suhomyces tanzawaensis NRRL Y-17324]
MFSNAFELAYMVLDTFIYYVINISMMVLIFSELVVTFSNNFVYNYNIVVSSFKHKMYNNIN